MVENNRVKVLGPNAPDTQAAAGQPSRHSGCWESQWTETLGRRSTSPMGWGTSEGESRVVKTRKPAPQRSWLQTWSMTWGTQQRQNSLRVAHSLYSTPIKHLWRDQKVSFHRQSACNPAELERIYKEECRKLLQSTGTKLVASYPKRLTALLLLPKVLRLNTNGSDYLCKSVISGFLQ